MIPRVFRHYRFLLLMGLVIVTAVIAATIFFVDKNFSPGDDTDTSTVSTQQAIPDFRARRVFVEGLDEYVAADHLDIGDHGTIENTLYTYVSQGRPDLYTGTIRTGSLRTINATHSELLIDIEPAQVTYKLTLVGANRTERAAISAGCAPKEQQLNSEVVCRDWDNL